jgi:transcriptional regulator with XRE-family HTH domain
MDNKYTFCERLRILRKENCFSTQQLADMLNIKQQTITCYEQEKAMPNAKNLIKLADIFDVSLDYLVGRSDIAERR